MKMVNESSNEWADWMNEKQQFLNHLPLLSDLNVSVFGDERGSEPYGYIWDAG